MSIFAMSMVVCFIFVSFLFIKTGCDYGLLKKKYNALLSSLQPGQKYTKVCEKRLFVALDGALASYHPVDFPEKIYEKGYFDELKTCPNVLEAIKTLGERDDVDVFVVSGYLVDSDYSLQEKNQWLDEHIPEIDKTHRIFYPYGSNRVDYIPGGIHSEDYILEEDHQTPSRWYPKGNKIELINSMDDQPDVPNRNRLIKNSPSYEIIGRIKEMMKLE